MAPKGFQMRTIPPALQTRLDSGVTTLCRCWTIKRADGVMQGFTEHDEVSRSTPSFAVRAAA
jgi:hypothetical protein